MFKRVLEFGRKVVLDTTMTERSISEDNRRICESGCIFFTGYHGEIGFSSESVGTYFRLLNEKMRREIKKNGENCSSD